MRHDEARTRGEPRGPWAPWTRGLTPSDALPPPPRAGDRREPIQGHTPERLAAASGAHLASARRIVAAVLKSGRNDLDALELPLRREDRVRVAEQHRVGRLRVVQRVSSKVDPFLKYLFEAEDGARFEAVRIPLEREGRFTVCISSQVGCAMGCRFCATGTLGFIRNLAAWEMVEQVRWVSRELAAGTRVHGVLFQGMGEPLANVEEVVRAIEVVSHPCGLAVDQRSITVSTAGICAGIRRLTEAGLRARLAISIGSARPELRRELIPLERRQPLAEVLDAAAEHARCTGQAPMLTVTLLSDVNTSHADATHLCRAAARVREQAGISPRVSLVAYNRCSPDDPLAPATVLELETFRQLVASEGFGVSRRYSGGADVGAACGQLVARAKP